MTRLHTHLSVLLLVALLGVVSIPVAGAKGMVGVMHKGVVIKPDQTPPELLLGTMAVVRKMRGLPAAEKEVVPVQFIDQAGRNLGEDAWRYQGLELQAIRLDAISRGDESKTAYAGAFLFKDGYQRYLESYFSLVTSQGKGEVLIHRAEIFYASPLFPKIWAAIVPRERAKSLALFRSYEEVMGHVRAQRIDITNLEAIPDGTHGYEVFGFFLDFMPDDDQVKLITSQSDSSGVSGEEGPSRARNLDGWRVVQLSRDFDLKKGKPVWIKAIHIAGESAAEGLKKEPRVVHAFSPMGGGLVAEPKVAKKGENPAKSTANEDVAKDAIKDQEPVNLAINRPTRVSSVSVYSKYQDVTEDGKGAVDGVIGRGGYGFHTKKEKNPWWQVDLGDGAVVQKVIIYNRVCCGDRAQTLQVLFSQDGENWQQLSNRDNKRFKKLTIPVEQKPIRFLRLQLNETNWFHLREVEVWGYRASN